MQASAEGDHLGRTLRGVRGAVVDLEVDETHPRDHGAALGHGREAEARKRGRLAVAAHQVLDRERPAAPYGAERLAERRLGIREARQALDDPHVREAPVVDRERRLARGHEADLRREPRAPRELGAGGARRRRGGDADDVAAEPRRQPTRGAAEPGAQVEHLLVLPEDAARAQRIEQMDPRAARLLEPEVREPTRRRCRGDMRSHHRLDRRREARAGRVGHGRAPLAQNLAATRSRALCCGSMAPGPRAPASPGATPAWYRRLPPALRRIAASSDRVPTVPLRAGPALRALVAALPAALAEGRAPEVQALVAAARRRHLHVARRRERPRPRRPPPATAPRRRAPGTLHAGERARTRPRHRVDADRQARPGGRLSAPSSARFSTSSATTSTTRSSICATRCTRRASTSASRAFFTRSMRAASTGAVDSRPFSLYRRCTLSCWHVPAPRSGRPGRGDFSGQWPDRSV